VIFPAPPTPGLWFDPNDSTFMLGSFPFGFTSTYNVVAAAAGAMISSTNAALAVFASGTDAGATRQFVRAWPLLWGPGQRGIVVPAVQES
jgi:hypothetical protein